MNSTALTGSTAMSIHSSERSILAGVLTLYISGHTDVYEYLYSVVAALAPVAIRYFNKNDLAFGKISGNSTVDEVATEIVEAVKKVAKQKTVAKPPVKKTSATKAAKKTETK